MNEALLTARRRRAAPAVRAWVRAVCARRAAGLAALAMAAGCTLRGGADWVHGGATEPGIARGGAGWIQAPPPDPGGAAGSGDRHPTPRAAAGEAPRDETPVVVREHGLPALKSAGAWAEQPGLFRNTYYDFPREDAGRQDTPLYDAGCTLVARVTRGFHDRVCVQGSGRLASGVTVSFARRGCACAEVCPRTGQQVCFDRLDPRQFPYGRGAMGKPVTPLRTVAVDSSVIPLGTPIFVPELIGLPLPDGGAHDGCFMAEDRGIKVVGRQIDVFTGDPGVTARLNAIFPSNRGVHVIPGDARCAATRTGGGTF